MIYNGDQEEIGSGVLVSQSHKSPDRNPNSVDLGDLIVRRYGHKHSQAHEPIAVYATEEVYRPLRIHARLGLGDSIGFLGVGGQNVRPAAEEIPRQTMSQPD